MSEFYANITDTGSSSMKLFFYSDMSTAHPLSRRDVLTLWKADSQFCSVFSDELASAPMEAFFWETPSFSSTTIDLPFECVLTPSQALAKQQQDTRPFANQIAGDGIHDVVMFEYQRRRRPRGPLRQRFRNPACTPRGLFTLYGQIANPRTLASCRRNC